MIQVSFWPDQSVFNENNFYELWRFKNKTYNQNVFIKILSLQNSNSIFDFHSTIDLLIIFVPAHIQYNFEKYLNKYKLKFFIFRQNNFDFTKWIQDWFLWIEILWAMTRHTHLGRPKLMTLSFQKCYVIDDLPSKPLSIDTWISKN